MAVMHHTIIIDIPYQKPSASLERLIKQMEKFDRVIKRVKNSAAKIGSRLVNAFKTGAMTAGLSGVQSALQNVARLGLAAAASFVTVNAEMELLRARLTTIEGSVEGGEKAFQRMLNLATEMPFSVDTIVDSFAKFKAAGIQEAEKYVRNLADAVAAFGGSSEDMKLATVAIQQMVGKGVISMEEMRRQLAERIPTAFAILADKAGLSIGELMDTIADGAALASEYVPLLMEGFEEAYSGAALRMMDTFAGSVQRVKTAWIKLMVAIGDGNESFASVRKVVDAVSQALNNFRTSAEGASIINDLSETIHKFVNDLSNPAAMQLFFTSLMSNLANVLEMFNAVGDKILQIVKWDDDLIGTTDFTNKALISGTGADVGALQNDIKLYMNARERMQEYVKLMKETSVSDMRNNVDNVSDTVKRLADELKRISSGEILPPMERTAKVTILTDEEQAIAGIEKVKAAQADANGRAIAEAVKLHQLVGVQIGQTTEGIAKIKEAIGGLTDKLASLNTQHQEDLFGIDLEAAATAIDKNNLKLSELTRLRAEAAAVSLNDPQRLEKLEAIYGRERELIKSLTFAEKTADKEKIANALKIARSTYAIYKKNATAQNRERAISANKYYEYIKKLENTKSTEADKDAFYNNKKAMLAELHTLQQGLIQEELEAKQSELEKLEELATRQKGYFDDLTNMITAYNGQIDKSMNNWKDHLTDIKIMYDDIITKAGQAAAASVEPSKHALGGPIAAGEVSWVGERGPELFVPNTNGKIVPNNKISKSSDSVNINLSLAGSKPAQLQGTPQSVADIQRAVKRYNRLAA